jgi:hypothetical protein
MNRYGKSTGMVVLVTVMVIALAGSLGYIFRDQLGFSSTDSPGNSPTAQVVQSGSCAIQPTLTASYVDKYNGSTIAPSTTKVYINGALSTCTTFPCNIDQGASYKVFVDDGQHYFATQGGNANACGSNTVQLAAQPNGSLATSAQSRFGIPGGATQATIGANDNQPVKVVLQAPAKQTFSNPLADNNPIICVKYNTSEITGVSASGLTSVGAPLAATSNSESTCWYAPFKSLSDNADSTVTFTLSSGSTNPGGATNMTGSVYPQDFFVSVDGTMKSGVEDDTGAHTAVGPRSTFSVGYN